MYWDAADCTVITRWLWNPRDTASTTRCPACDFRVYVLRTRESVVGGQQVQEVVPLKLRTIYGQWLIWASPLEGVQPVYEIPPRDAVVCGVQLGRASCRERV